MFCTEYPKAEPLDAHYYLGQGARGGRERTYVAELISTIKR